MNAKRIGRHLFGTCAAVSLLLCVALVALWLRSLGHFERVDLRYARWPRPDDGHTFFLGFSWYSNTLRLELIYVPLGPAYFRGEPVERLQEAHRDDPPGLRWQFLGDSATADMNGYDPGYEARHYPYGTGTWMGDRWVLAVRPWLPTLLAAVLPMIWAIRFVATRRAWRAGQCSACGYDLRATPERCPECGLAPQR